MSTSISTSTSTSTSSSTFTLSSPSSSHAILPELSTTDNAVIKSAAPELEFKCFSKLPAELRVKIWKLVPKARIIEVRFRRDGRNNEHKFIAAFPAILQVCHESRVEGLKRYKQAFISKWAINRVHFDFEIDILYLSHVATDRQKWFFLKRIPRCDGERVQRIAESRGGFFYMPYLSQVKEWLYIGNFRTSPVEHKSIYSSKGVEFYDLEELEELVALGHDIKIAKVQRKGQKDSVPCNSDI